MKRLLICSAVTNLWVRMKNNYYGADWVWLPNKPSIREALSKTDADKVLSYCEEVAKCPMSNYEIEEVGGCET